MESLRQLVVATTGNTALAPWLFAIVIGAAILLLTLAAVGTSAIVFDPIRRRLQRLREGTESLVVTETATRVEETGGFWTWLTPKSGEKLSGLKAQLAQAGFRGPEAVGVMYAAKILCLGLLPLGTWLATTVLASPMKSTALMALVAGAAFLGWIGPNVFLDKRVQARKDLLMSGFPDALDLLVACTEAGLGFNAALERVVEQMPLSHPDLAEELSLVNAEIRAGLDRAAALRNLAERTGLEEVRGLVSLITHSTRLGSGIAGTLRVYAEDFRDRRMQRAEEQAAMVGTKMTFPLIVCLFPAFFIVAVGPAAIRLIDTFSRINLPG